MKSITLPAFDTIDQVLSETTHKLHPSLVHGILSGLLCGDKTTSAAWEEWVAGEKVSGKTHDVLQALYEDSAKQLKEFSFEFELVLPDDDAELPLRAEALTVWTQGFLTGLKLVQIPVIDREPGEVTDAINDLIEIAKMNYEQVIANEEDEAAFAELEEYVRMAVIMIYQDLHEDKTPKRPKKSTKQLH